MNKNLIIAVDGTAASGKGSLARNLAKHFKCAYLDTGKLYRLVGYIVIKEKISTHNVKLIEKKLKDYDFSKVNFENPKLKTENVGKVASIIASYIEIRSILLNYQREFASMNHKRKNGVILDGRDIGTIVLPNADIKFFINASVAVRGDRRWKELISLGQSTIKRNVLEEIRSRDERDSQRKNSPLIPASDAILLDTTNLSVNEVFLLAKKYVENYLN